MAASPIRTTRASVSAPSRSGACATSTARCPRSMRSCPAASGTRLRPRSARSRSVSTGRRAAGAENYRVEMSADGGSTWIALPLTAKPVCIVTGSRAGNGVHVPPGRLHAGGRQVVFLAVLLQHGHGDDAARRRVCTVRTARHDRRAGGWAHRDRPEHGRGAVSVFARERGSEPPRRDGAHAKLHEPDRGAAGQPRA